MSKASVQFIEIARERYARPTVLDVRPLYCDLCCRETGHNYAGKASRGREWSERWQCETCGLIKSFQVR